MALPQVCDGKLFTLGKLPDLHGEEGDRPLLVALVVDIDQFWIGLDGDRLDGRGKEVEQVAQRYAEREAVPECGYGVGRSPRGIWGSGEGEIAGKAPNSQQTGAQRRALLVKRCGLGGRLVEQRVVCNGERVDHGA